MNGITKTIWIKVFVTALLAVLASNLVLAKDKKYITIIKSSDNSYYNQSIETLKSLSSNDLAFDIIDVHSDEFKNLQSNKNTLLVALGINATRKILQQHPKQISISAYITKDQVRNLPVKTNRHLAVLLDQPLGRYLAFSNNLTKPKTLGLINSQAIKLGRTQKQLLAKLNLDLLQKQPDGPRDLLNTIRLLKRHSNSLLILPDQKLFNRDTLKGVLLTTYRNRIPVISYSPSHVNSGALGSIYSSPEDIGKHLADLVKKFQEGKLKTGSTPQFARYFTIVTNDRVAHSLGLDLPDPYEIRHFLNEVSP